MRLVRALPPLLVLVLLAAAVISLGGMTYAPLFAIPVVMLAPALFMRDGQPPSTGPDDDDNGGQRRNRRPPPRPPGPTGGIPLPDAAQSHLRIRDQGPVRLRPVLARRPPSRPGHSPRPRKLPARRPKSLRP